MRSRLLLLLLALSEGALCLGQFGVNFDDYFSRIPDARAEAMGRGDVAMPGDTRNMFSSPAALIDVDGIDAYFRHASPYYFFEKTTFTHAALAYRISERFAMGMRYDQTELKSDILNFGNMIDLPESWSDPATDEVPGVFGATLTFKVMKDLSVGTSISDIHFGKSMQILAHADVGVLKIWRLKEAGTCRHTLRVAASLQNVSSERVDRSVSTPRGFVFSEHYALPVITRIGAAYRLAFHNGWLSDSLPSLAFTAHVQYDDDLTSKYYSAWHFGGELEIIGALALRAGWYTVSVSDGGYPQYNKSDISAFTYGLGVKLPLAALTGNKWPLTVSFDYTSLPQVSFTTDDLSAFTGKPWENFQSYGIRVDYGIGRIFKPKPKTT